jgi:exosortase
MSDADQKTSSPHDRLFRLAAMVAILGLGTVAFRSLLEYDPTSVDRNLDGSDAAFFSPSANNPFMVYAVAAWISFQRRKSFFAALGSPSSLVPGAALIVGASIACAWAYYVRAPDLLLVSFALTCLGLSWLMGGGAALRVALLPALVLLALIPIPAVLVNALVYELQLATSTISVEILNMVGLQAAQAADQFAVGGRHFQVIESCSGIRSTQTLLLTAILFQEIFYRCRMQSVLLVISAPFLGFVINQVRVLTLVFNPYSGLASVHTAQGLIMLVTSILLLAGLDALLSRWLPLDPKSTVRHRGQVALPRLALAATAVGLVAASSLVEPSPNIERELDWNPHDIPLRISDWHSQPLRLDRQYLGSTTFSKDANRRFHRGDEFVDVFAGVSERGRRSRSPISPKTLPLGAGRIVLTTKPFSLGPEAPDATAATIRTNEGLHRVVLWHSNVGAFEKEAFRALLALDRGPGRRPGLPQVIRLSTPIARPRDIETADSRLRTFAGELLEEIEDLKVRARKNRQLQSQRR